MTSCHKPTEELTSIKLYFLDVITPPLQTTWWVKKVRTQDLHKTYSCRESQEDTSALQERSLITG